MKIKKATVATVAALVMASSLAYAAETSSSTVGMTHPDAADLTRLTDTRIGIIKAALQLTPDQEKYWPAVEDAIRARAKNRHARWERVADMRDGDLTASLGDRNLIELMKDRAEALTQRGADLNKVAGAWEPLYKTLSQDQKKRMAFITVVGFRGLRDTIENHMESDDDED